MAFDIPAYALGDQELWNPKLVKEALVDAFVVCERTVGRVGPKAAQAAWPVVYDLNDIWEQRRTGSNQQGRGAKPQITALQIQRSEQVLMGGQGMAPWLRGPMADHPLRLKLEVWVLHEAGKALGRSRRSLREICAMQGWAERSFYRDVERAAGAIAARLNKLSIGTW
jgi:hypothetical protein